MSEIKIRLSLSVRGAQRVSWEEAQKHPKESYDLSVIKVEAGSGRKGKIYDTFAVKTLKNRVIKQNVQLSKDAYDYMISDYIPSDEFRKTVYIRKNGKKKGVSLWESFTEKQKLDWHLKQLADSLGAIDFSYEILED